MQTCHYNIDPKDLGKLPQFVENLEETIFNREIEQAFMNQTKKIFQAKTKPSLLLSTEVGNMYTPSLYACLVSYICNETNLADKKVALFSYGSGLASSFFSLQIKEGSGLEKIRQVLSDVGTRLKSRTKISPGN